MDLVSRLIMGTVRATLWVVLLTTSPDSASRLVRELGAHELIQRQLFRV